MATAANLGVEPRRLAVQLPTRGIGREQVNRVLPLVALFYTILLCPPEVSFTVAGQWLPAYRVVLILSAIFVVKRAFTGGARGLTLPDVFVVSASVWVLISFVNIYGVTEGFSRGSGMLLDILGSYILARTSVTSFSDFRLFLLLTLPALLLSGALMVLESLSGRLFVRPTLASVFGNVSSYSGGEAAGSVLLREEVRMGLLRAYGTFSHPILAGVILGSFFPLFYFSGIRSWAFLAGIAAAAAGVFSLSSAAFLGLVIIGAGILIDYLRRNGFSQFSWWTIISMLSLLVFVAHMASKNGIIAVLSRFTLTPHTARYRIVIWQEGSKTVRENPIFGIGYQQWERLSWMGESVDAHFLLLAMRHGIIVPILLLVGIIFAMMRLGYLSGRLSLIDKRTVIGVNMTMLMMLITAQTVAFFGASNLAFMAMVGLLVSLMSFAGRPSGPRRVRVQVRPNAPPPAPPGRSG